MFGVAGVVRVDCSDAPNDRSGDEGSPAKVVETKSATRFGMAAAFYDYRK